MRSPTWSSLGVTTWISDWATSPQSTAPTGSARSPLGSMAVRASSSKSTRKRTPISWRSPGCCTAVYSACPNSGLCREPGQGSGGEGRRRGAGLGERGRPPGKETRGRGAHDGAPASIHEQLAVGSPKILVACVFIFNLCLADGFRPSLPRLSSAAVTVSGESNQYVEGSSRGYRKPFFAMSRTLL